MVNETMRAERFELGRVIGMTFELIGRNFLSFLFFALIFAGIPNVLGGYVQLQMVADPMNMRQNLGLSIALPFISIAAAIILQAVLTRASIDDLTGRGVTFGDALSAALRVLFPLLGLTIVLGLGIGVGALLLLVPGIILAVRWLVASPAMIGEKLTIGGSLGRSADLTKGHRWAIFGLALLYVVAMYSLLGILAVIAQTTTISFNPIYLLGAVPVISTLTSLVGTVGTATIYFELRRLKEGVDVSDLAKIFD